MQIRLTTKYLLDKENVLHEVEGRILDLDSGKLFLSNSILEIDFETDIPFMNIEQYKEYLIAKRFKQD